MHMRTSLVVLLVLLLPASAAAQNPQRLKITGVRVGFNAGLLPNEQGKQYLSKAGQWTPVSVDVIVGDEGLIHGELEIEATDSDEVQNVYRVALSPRNPRETFTALAFTKAGNGEIVVRVRGDKNVQHEFKLYYDAMNLDDLLFLSVGSSLTGLKQSLARQVKKDEAGPNAGEVIDNEDHSLNRGRVGTIDSVAQMPAQWFGYQPVDLMILTTGDRDFVEQLLGQKAQVEALAEWVRRGGRLVVSAGRNQDAARQLLKDLMRDALPLDMVPGGLQLSRLQSVENWLMHNTPPLTPGPVRPGLPPAAIDVAHLQVKAGHELELLLKHEDKPLIARMPYGMGQVVLVAFDLDRPPFAGWTGQTDFWKKLQAETGANLSSLLSNQKNYGYGHRDDLAGSLRNNLEVFPDVTNVSFGWVALFIFIYILVVGPLDYFFLKKVVKRLELTWITFPTVVLVVSAVAYFTAYALKGNELRINKVDVVDIDLKGETAYGHTWFTLFSPRIQDYTIGIEPAAPTWVPEPIGDKKASSVLLSWMGRPDENHRFRSQSLFRRAYSYTRDAVALEGVPIQVWTTKSFCASWERPLRAEQPLLRADLKHVRGLNIFEGTLTSQLPVDLDNVFLVYGGGPTKGQVFALERPLDRGATQTLAFPHRAKPLSEWRTTSHETGNLNALLQGMFFHEAINDSSRNLTVRDLDESWRLRLKNEVILIGRVKRASADAEVVNTGPESPSRLWLGKVPAAGDSRPSLPGVLTQNTYVRIFIPIQGEELEP